MAKESSRTESSGTVVMIDIRPGPSTPAQTAAWSRFWRRIVAPPASPESGKPHPRTSGDQVLVANKREGNNEHQSPTNDP